MKPSKHIERFFVWFQLMLTSATIVTILPIPRDRLPIVCSAVPSQLSTIINNKTLSSNHRMIGNHSQ